MAGGLNINASESVVSRILSKDDRYTVPDYQRLYSWDEQQWEDFWNDLRSITDDETHFLGSIVVIKRPGSYDTLDKMELVDGQQRLTTITLLLCAFREYYESNGDPEGLGEKIDEDYLHADDMNNNIYPNLSLSKQDDPDLKSILDGNPSDAEGSQLYEALEFFRDKIDDLSADEVDQSRKRLLGSMTLVVIDTENPESAFRLFETLNNRGLELSAVDLMKNSLLQEAMDRYPGGFEDPDYKHIRDQWEKLLDDVVREISKPNRFFRHYIMSAPKPDKSTSISNYKLYEEFRSIIKHELSTGDELKEYIDGMVDIADLYVGFTQASVDEFDSRSQKKINERLQNLNDIQSVHARTLLIRSFREFDEFSKIQQVLQLLEVFMTRWKLAGEPSGSGLDTIFADLCSNAFNEPDPIAEIKSRLEDEAPDNDKVRVNVISRDFKRNGQTRYVLDTLERVHYGGRGIDRSIVDIEHIAPQKTFDAKKYSPWRKVIGVNEEAFDDYCNKLGNLTLLENRHNAAAGADPFDEKKQYYLSSDFEITQEIRDYDEWNKDNIMDRTEELAEACVEVWNFDNYEAL